MAAEGRLTLMFWVRSICRLTIMKEASRKNMMSISGMISIRECRRLTGEANFICSGRVQPAIRRGAWLPI